MALRPAMAVVSLLATVLAGGAACRDERDAAAKQPLTVYAASSLRDALPALDDSARYDFAGSGQLQLRIERGAPADLLLSASPKEPRALHAAGRCGPPVAVATNRLVLVVPRGNPAELRSVQSLRRGERRLAVGSTSVPVGDYTRRLLSAMGLSSVLRSNVVSSEANVSGIVSKVALRSADAGFVYVTDARAAEGRVESIALPRDAQPAVRYEACVVRRKEGDKLAAGAFLRNLTGDRGRAVLRRQGFGLPPRSR